MSTEVACRSRSRTRGAHGFTLVELLVVIVILGMLSGVVVFAVGNLSSNSGAAACAADASTITSAEEAYKALHTQYVSEAGLVSDGQLSSASSLHDIVVANGSYTLLDVGRCAGGSGAIAAGGSSSGGGSTGATVQLMNSSGTPLPGAQVEYLNGSWLALGTTANDGSAASNLPSGTYQFRVDYRGQTQTLPATAVTAGTPVVIHTVPVTVHLTGGAGDHSGADITHQGNDGFWMTDDSTDGSGTSALELLPGTYTFRADYHGETNLSAPTGVVSATTASFPLTTVTVGVGEAGAAVEHRANNGEWISDGATSSSNTATFDALAGDYTVRAHRQNNSQPQTDVSVTGATITVNLP